MTPQEIIQRLRATKSESKRKLLDEAADTIEQLMQTVDKQENELKWSRAKRDTVTKRMIELEEKA